MGVRLGRSASRKTKGCLKIRVNHKIRQKFNTLLHFKLDPTINLILHSVLITGCNLKSKIMATIMNLEIKRKNRICLKSRLRVRIEIYSRKKCTKSMLILKLKQHHPPLLQSQVLVQNKVRQRAMQFESSQTLTKQTTVLILYILWLKYVH